MGSGVKRIQLGAIKPSMLNIIKIRNIIRQEYIYKQKLQVQSSTIMPQEGKQSLQQNPSARTRSNFNVRSPDACRDQLHQGQKSEDLNKNMSANRDASQLNSTQLRGVQSAKIRNAQTKLSQSRNASLHQDSENSRGQFPKRLIEQGDKIMGAIDRVKKGEVVKAEGRAYIKLDTQQDGKKGRGRPKNLLTNPQRSLNSTLKRRDQKNATKKHQYQSNSSSVIAMSSDESYSDDENSGFALAKNSKASIRKDSFSSDPKLEKRVRKNNVQRKLLKDEYDKSYGRWEKDEMKNIAKHLGLSNQQVYKWYWDTKKKESEAKPSGEGLASGTGNDFDRYDDTIEAISQLLGINKLVERLAHDVIETSSPTNSRIISKAPTRLKEDFSSYSAHQTSLNTQNNQNLIANAGNALDQTANFSSTKKQKMILGQSAQIQKICSSASPSHKNLKTLNQINERANKFGGKSGLAASNVPTDKAKSPQRVIFASNSSPELDQSISDLDCALSLINPKDVPLQLGAIPSSFIFEEQKSPDQPTILPVNVPPRELRLKEVSVPVDLTLESLFGEFMLHTSEGNNQPFLLEGKMEQQPSNYDFYSGFIFNPSVSTIDSHFENGYSSSIMGSNYYAPATFNVTSAYSFGQGGVEQLPSTGNFFNQGQTSSNLKIQENYMIPGAGPSIFKNQNTQRQQNLNLRSHISNKRRNLTPQCS
ncbi:hypothetical protein FGO68_gene4372 [Halteria grandinella]|uniref:Homeobox domain-containing protein n=1 Tax=Halteria grandinella TaxID=5974 RepID=A0A8J8NFH1_HALGN|nr:hypothetical protein FGO68_gene4372 [Halteria grandinella]